MKRFLSICSVFILFLSISAYTQEKLLTIEDAVLNLYGKLGPERINGIQWRPGINEYSFLRQNSLWVYNIDNSNESVVTDLNTLNKQLVKNEEDSLKSFPAIEWINTNSYRFFKGNTLIIYDVDKQKIEAKLSLPESSENFDINPQNTAIAYTLGNNLNFITEKQEETSIANDRNLEIVYGTTVHRNEFGIEKGIFWSPSGTKLAFYRKDETKVGSYPLVDITQAIASVENIKYPMAGTDSEEVTLGVYNISSKETVYMKTGTPADHYLTNIAWSPDEKTIYIAVLNREQTHMKFNSYDAASGEFVKTLFEERNTKYVEPLHPMTFVPGNDNQFIWQSRRNGYNHLFLYDTSGTLLKQITSGEWEVIELYGFSPDGKSIFIKANKESPIDFDIYRVELSNNKITRLSNTKGSHNAIVQSDGNFIIDVYSNTDIPSKYELIDKEGKNIKTLLESKNPLIDYKLAKMSIGKIKSADGTTDLFYRIILPPDFDKAKKYPCIVYVYGGPHAQLVTNRWLGGAAGWDYYMAQNGYIMFCLDNRGSANRGLNFENVIHRNLGVAEMEDQMKGIEYLQNLDYVDMDRIGVHGWSYGGFMTISMMLNHSDVFKVGVAGGPVIDWKYYEVMYGERYMDTPEENYIGYEKVSLLNKTDKLKGRLMIIHGAIDNTVVWQHSLAFINECIKTGTLVDYFVYPRHEHNVRGPDRVHLMKTVTRYFDDHLK